MSFTLLACSDIRGEKVNLELPFAHPPPSLDALRGTLERIFRMEEQAIKAARGYTDARPCEPFTINRVQRYDDDRQSWAEVTAVDMIETYDQLYVFRRNSTKADISTQRELPPPRTSPYFEEATPLSGDAAALHTPRRGHPSTTSPNRPYAEAGNLWNVSASPSRLAEGGSPAVSQPSPRSSGAVYSSALNNGSSPLRQTAHQAVDSIGPSVPLSSNADPSPPAGYYYKERTTPERVEYLYRLGSQPQGGSYLTVKNLEYIFRLSQITFPAEVTEDLFRHFAVSPAANLAAPAAGGGSAVGAGQMNYDSFQDFANTFPVLINIAYQRITNQEREDAIRGAQQENAKQVNVARRQLQDLENRLAAVRREVQQAEAKQARMQEDLNELSLQRDPAYCRDEQKLLDKEVSVFKYRERLSMEERDYERLAIERRKRAVYQQQQQQQQQQNQMPAASGAVPYGGFSPAYDENRYGPRI